MITAKRRFKRDTPLDLTIGVSMSLSDRATLVADIHDVVWALGRVDRLNTTEVEKLKASMARLYSFSDTMENA
jgi:hypothetical protein